MKPILSMTRVLDFSSPVFLEVLSEDEPVREQWEISVRFSTAENNPKIFKKGAVCYNGGAIKVLSDQNGIEIFLFKNQVEWMIFNY